MNLEQAILRNMSVSMQEMRSTVRTERLFIARLIYADMRRRLGANASDVAKDLCKSRRNVYYYYHQARIQIDFNRDFTRLYRAVEAVVMPRVEYSPLAFSPTRRKRKATYALPPDDLFPESLSEQK